MPSEIEHGLRNRARLRRAIRLRRWLPTWRATPAAALHSLSPQNRATVAAMRVGRTRRHRHERRVRQFGGSHGSCEDGSQSNRGVKSGCVKSQAF